MRRSTLPALLAICCVLGLVLSAGVIVAKTPPGAPTVDTATPGTTSISITWTAPSDVGSVAIVAYDLHYIRSDASDKSDSKWTEKQDIWSSGSLTYTIAGLRRDTSFDIQVRAVNSGTSNTDGPWSATKEGSTTDHGGSRSAATTLSLGSSLEGSIDPADDADYFRIVVPAATDLWVYTSGALDTTGELITSGGTLIAKNYDGRLVDHPLGFSIRAQRNSGTYYVKVTSHAGESTGAYQIHTEAVVAPGDTFGTAKVIELDSKAAGRIHRTIGNVNDTDMFKFELASNTEVWIVATTPFASNAILYNESRSRISSSDNGGWTYNHRNFMIRRLLDVGTYFLKVAGDNALGSGPYALYLKTVTEGGSSQATATPLTLNVAQTGSLSLVSDREYFSFTLDEETYLSVYAASFGSGLEISVDGLSAMTESYQISRTDYSNAGIRAASFLKWGKLAAGAYNISTSPSTQVGGDYLLHVRTSRYGDVSGTCTATLTTTMSDPWYGCQWHLDNTDQFANSAGQDINVQELWDETDPATMGAGIRVAVVDDGMHFTHEDLTDNVLTSHNRTYSLFRSSIYNPVDTHGTAVASIIAARDNSSGVRGVAPRASIFGIKVATNVPFTSSTQAGAADPKMSNAAVFNNSWGPVTRGRLFRPSMAWETAVKNGVDGGFGGKGILYVFSAGNGHLDGDYSGLNGFANYYAVTAVCAVNYADVRTSYSEMGSNLWICAPSSDNRALPEMPGITTADNSDRYRKNFGGTSASAPIVSGVAALIRAADRGTEPTLSWRDVKLILANSARKNDPTNRGWRDGALKHGSTTDRYSFNHEYGFGMVDAGAAVALAKTWTTLPKMREMTGTSTDQPQAIPDAPSRGTPGRTIESTLTIDDYVEFIEFVEINIDFQHTYFGDLNVELVSPSGKRSSLSVTRKVYVSNPVNGFFRLGSARHLGENSAGTWKLRVTDHRPGETGRLDAWKIKVYGHGVTPDQPDIDSTTAGDQSITVDWKTPDDKGTSEITKYDLRFIRSDASDKSDAQWSARTDITTATYEITGLEAGVYYDIQMRAQNDAGPGQWSEVLKATTLDPLPSVPRSISVAARDMSLVVSWQEPSSSGGKASSYDVRQIESDATHKDDPNNWTDRIDAWKDGGGDLRYLIGSLTNGEQYDVQVRAVNDGGDGEWSSTVTGTPVMGNSQPQFPSGADYTRGVDENTAAGMGFGDPVSARDDDSDTLTYSLGSGSDFFDIDEFSGRLRTESALNHEDRSSYRITVRVGDLKDSAGVTDTAIDDTVTVIVGVNNVDEPPVIMGPDSPTFDENSDGVVASYSARDPENDAIVKWDVNGLDGDQFEITDGRLSFIASPDFEARSDLDHDNDYEVTVVADAGTMEGSHDVTVTVEDVNEAPVVSGTDEFVLDENQLLTENRGRLSTRYAARDPENDTTSWSLSGPDDDDFEIDDFGELSFKSPPDYDMPGDRGGDNKYEVTVRATDDGTPQLTGEVDVEIYVSGVPEPPVVSGKQTVDFTEGRSGAVETYRATDPERDTVIWSLRGSHADSFNFVSGVLSFRSPPNYEDRATYFVTIRASDGDLFSDHPVTVNIIDVDELEVLTLSSVQPVENVGLTSTLTEPDRVTNKRWQWQRSQSRSNWSDISGASSADYTPANADVGYYLRVTVTYDDPHRIDRTLTATTSGRVVAAPVDNDPPTFSPDETGQRSVDENSRHLIAIGLPVEATDPESDRLVYSIDTTHENRFEVGRRSGQLRVGSAADLDRELRETYEVTVSVSDPFNPPVTQRVTVTIEDVNEPPVAEGDSITTREDTPAAIHVLTNDSDPEFADLSVTAPTTTRNASLVVEPSGIILYGPNTNFNGQDSFTYQITDGTHRATATVIVVVTPVNDAPEFSTGPVELEVAKAAEAGDNVGKAVTATDIDGDTPRYTLSFSSEFEIDERSGQITVKQGATIDPMVDSYGVTVTADDQQGQFNSRASVDVTINVLEQVTRRTTTTGGGGGGGGGGGPPPIPIPSDEDFDWNVTHDIEALERENDLPTGIWSDGEILWVVENSASGADRIFAYQLADGERVPLREFELDRRNRFSHGIWSDGEAVWVADSGQDQLFAYVLESGERREDRDFDLAERNRDPRGIWSDGEIIYVLDSVKDALFAYDFATGELLAEHALDKLNRSPRGIWSDGVTIWVSDDGAKRLFGYEFEDGTLARNEDLEFTFRSLLKAGNGNPRGIWSDGDVIYVVDEQDDKVYTYNIPDAIIALLSSLTLSEIEIGEFSPARLTYSTLADTSATVTTVEAVATQEAAMVVIAPSDADGDAENGHQVALGAETEITIAVTSSDGSRTKTYRIHVEKPPCLTSLTTERLSEVTFVGGSLDDLGRCAREHGVGAFFHWTVESWLLYAPDAPEFLSRQFRQHFADGVAAGSAFVAAAGSNGQPDK